MGGDTENRIGGERKREGVVTFSRRNRWRIGNNRNRFDWCWLPLFHCEVLSANPSRRLSARERTPQLVSSAAKSAETLPISQLLF